MSALIDTRAAIKTALQTALGATVQVSEHSGQFLPEELARYSKRAPAVVVALLRFRPVIEGGTVFANATWGIVTIAKLRGKDATAVDLADQVCRCLLRAFPRKDTSYSVSALREGNAINLYTGPLDKEGIAMWGVEFTQKIELVDTVSTDDLHLIDTLYDFTDRDADAPEAEDQIDTT